MGAFIPTRSLLNPKFEGYKLDPIHQEDIVVRYPLEYKPTQATTSRGTTFSYQEVQSRITHNHISVQGEGSRALYVDSESRVILIDVNAGNIRPSFRVVYELPSPVRSDAIDLPNNEYPSTAFLTSSMVFVSDGHGTMYILQIREGGAADVLGILFLEMSMNTPFRIHSAHRLSPTTAFIILSSRRHVEVNNSGTDSRFNDRGKRPPPADFDVWAVKIELLSLQPHDKPRQMDILWQRRGQDVPIYTAYEESLGCFLLLGGVSYRETTHLDHPPYEPTADEFASVPRVGGGFDTQGADLLKPPSYSWNQTHDSVTVAFPLPSSTPKSLIKVLFTSKTITVHIDNEVETSVPIPRYSAKVLWDGILTSTSYWTWDREAEHLFGMLTLHLDKQHEGTRWSHVFASVGTSVGSELSQDDVEVPETLDPSELWQIREALEKYTTALRDGDDASGLGLGRGVPSLAEGEIDMEVDESVGRSAYLTWVGRDGAAPEWWKETRDISFQLLSTPLPGSDKTTSIVTKSNLDGTLFSIKQVTPSAGEWIHDSTFSALAFVLASKQDLRFTYHISDKAVYAFEGGTRDRGGNVYIYRASPVSEKWAKQAILKVDDGYGGPLLGVGAVNTGAGLTILCLTEGELILIKNA
ncbi:hypothetical protein BDZ94DRAFT_670134 [Collybia nuda]|uniref:NudC domain-containing protein 1 n=1 Tax=Collybia nuda TaxID=64659 RepID=A0A9P6CJJ0_9AGAR|nr:hypothetical protein BDZ94DRAFT_670134 [Collybia nuda]